ncbi:MAG: DegT/DnrJ/EryC1/StrS family aminotransferase [Armatimonadetes bacterium]|nr:DegT/DnrJ/EryC1/StrS family aminotransferase [Armatimonadota bacterium]
MRLVGAVPVLVDAEPEGYGLDIAAAERAISTRTRALLAVHLYGEPVALEPLLFLAREREFRVVEDCSHGHGARRQGRHVGSFGDVGAVSCGVVKNLGAYGDAGIVITGDAEVAQRVRRLRVHGQTTRSNHVEYGTNSRLDELQAAVLRVKLRRLEARNARRRTIARYYRTELRGQPIQLPEERPEQVPAFHQYVVQLSRRDAVRAWLAERGVETGVHYPVPLHRQPAWQGQYRPVGPFPRAEALADRILSLPISPDLTDAEVEFCAVAVRDALEACRVRGGAP